MIFSFFPFLSSRRLHRRVVSFLCVLLLREKKRIFCSSGAIFQLTISRSHALFVQQQPNEDDDDEATWNSLRSCALLLLLRFGSLFLVFVRAFHQTFFSFLKGERHGNVENISETLSTTKRKRCHNVL
jgi:hypothetical protein